MQRLKTNWIKAVVPTISFYLNSFLFVYYMGKVSPSGPCVPGIGVMAFLLLIPVIAFLLLRKVFFAAKGSRIHLVRAMLHLLVCALIVLPIYL